MSTKTAVKEPKKVKESPPTGEREHLHHLLREMILIRRYEEKAAELYQATKIRGFLHLYIGDIRYRINWKTTKVIHTHDRHASGDEQHQPTMG